MNPKKVIDSDGVYLDATYEIEENDIIYHSRSGKKPTLSNGKNADYAKGLTTLLKQLRSADIQITDAWLDSHEPRIQALSAEERRIVPDGGFSDEPEELSSRMRRNMANIGSQRTAASGNRTRRIRIRCGNTNSDAIEYALSGKGVMPIPPSLEDLSWVEGGLRYVLHLKRERAHAAAWEKKAEFKKQHGRLFCEKCKMDPTKEYGELGESCIEVHHAAKQVSEMDDGHKTKLSDLQCLCANCHRIEHAQLKHESSKA